MPLKNTRDEWGSVSKLLHWVVVALVLAMAWLGLTMGDLPNGPDKAATYALHKSIGLTLLAVVVLRLGWRLLAGAPAPVAGTPQWQARIASLTHWALYALLLAIPLSGWLMNSAAGFPLQWFGLVDVPAIAGQDQALRERAGDLHELLFWALASLALVHVAAALYHHLFAGDATLARMLPRGWLRRTGTEPRDVA
jgi:cytochrome b561